jgi:hypothetical protein
MNLAYGDNSQDKCSQKKKELTRRPKNPMESNVLLLRPLNRKKKFLLNSKGNLQQANQALTKKQESKDVKIDPKVWGFLKIFFFFCKEQKIVLMPLICLNQDEDKWKIHEMHAYGSQHLPGDHLFGKQHHGDCRLRYLYTNGWRNNNLLLIYFCHLYSISFICVIIS